jgi:hypothetical protein
MYKIPHVPAMDRHVALYRRQMQDQILVSFMVSKRPEEIGDYLPVAARGAGQEWMDRPCRAEADMEGIMEEARQEHQALAHLPDDGLPSAYPTAHFGESIFSAMLGGSIRFVGTSAHTCSGAEPLLADWGDLPKLRYGSDMPWTRRYLKSLRAAADLDASEMFFWHFVTIDTLNLAVELRGSTEAYLDIVDSPVELAGLMRFGVDYARWFYQLEREIIGPHNLAVARGHCYAREAPYIGLPWSSVDAYLLCDSRVYREMGLSYHARFFESCGGGAMHTHGARLLELLPIIVEIPALTAVQVGRDLPDGRELPLLDLLPELRRIAGDIPLIRCLLWQEEFERGLREHRLVGGSHYIVRCPALETDQISRWMEQVYTYRWHG